MGQFMSANRTYSCNDELINALIKAKTILSIDVEKVFRCVDRGFYFPDSDKTLAYRDTAWISESFHLSAPSVYATVMECLELQEGNKFLNIGSGLGYINTLAGLLLGINGVNHGIEINSNVIDYAHMKLEEFKQKSAAIDHINFCEPIFVHGNACELFSMGYYDKVYCGAGVPPEESEFLKSLIKIGGILVMPLEGLLLKIIRKSEHCYDTIEVLEVTFTNLIVPDNSSFNTVKFPVVEPLNLQELCRTNIRSLIRTNIINKFPSLSIATKCRANVEESKFVTDNYVDLRYHPEILENIASLVESFNTHLHNGDLSSTSSDSDDVSDEENDNNKLDEQPKRKSLGAESSEQNKLSEEKINPKRMKMNSSSWTESSSGYSDSQGETSTSSVQPPHGHAATAANDDAAVAATDDDDAAAAAASDDDASGDDDDAATSSDSDDSDSDNNVAAPTVASGDANYSNNAEDYDEANEGDNSSEEEEYDHAGSLSRLHHSLYYSGDSSDDENSITSEDARDLITYKFVNDHKTNELSINLREKIDLLPIPVPLKHFLNYNRVD